ncbi:MAG: hypothetical protein HGA19_11155, partial [Oscillochloris sp.]|nr:hypothetical protein [Oscillochloris sp.]
HTYASDEEHLFRVAANLGEHGSFALNAGTGDPPIYSAYGPGQSVLAVPFYLIGRTLASAFPAANVAYSTHVAISWFNPLVTAGIAALIALASLRLGYSLRSAGTTALIYGLATMAWPHSKTFFAEPLASGLTFAAFTLLLGGKSQPGNSSVARYVMSGLLATLACTVKIQAGLALPLLGFYVLYQITQQAAATAPPLSCIRHLGSYIPVLAAFALGSVLGLGTLGAYQWVLFGSPLHSGYGGANGVFSGSLREGLYGLLISSGKGIIWYAPPLLLLPFGLVWLYQRNRGAAMLCGAIALATVLFYGKVTFWHGDGAWGPRYLNMALPFMALPLVAVADATFTGRRAPALALAATLALAIPVQFAGEAINLNAYLGVQHNDHQRYFVPSQSPIIGHLRLAAAQLGRAYHLYIAPQHMVLSTGFSYSEGDRTINAQLPRWTLPSAQIALRPIASENMRVALAVSGCRPAPITPATIFLRLDGTSIGEVAACPPRHISLLLPGRPAHLQIDSSAWSPADAGIDRAGPLGIFVSTAAAWVGEIPMELSGTTMPIPPVPTGPVALRFWTSDYRYGHWDVWWWYLAHSGLPATPSIGLALGWAGLALILSSTGAGMLWRMRQHL